METTGDRQKDRIRSRLTWRGLITGILGALALGAALLFLAGEANAAPVNVPGIGEFDIPEIPAPHREPIFVTPMTTIQVPQIPVEQTAAPVSDRSVTVAGLGEFRVPSFFPPLTGIPGVSDTATEQAAAPASDRSVTVAGLGEFRVPNFFPQLTGIPGVSETVIAPRPAPMPETTGQRALDAARSKLGAYYRMGGTGPDSFDCSGFVQWSYRQAGVEVPRTSYSQLAAGTPVSLDELEPGDLVSFYGGGHSALYLGDGQVIHASDSASGVKISPMSNMPVTGARRF